MFHFYKWQLCSSSLSQCLSLYCGTLSRSQKAACTNSRGSLDKSPGSSHWQLTPSVLHLHTDIDTQKVHRVIMCQVSGGNLCQSVNLGQLLQLVISRHPWRYNLSRRICVDSNTGALQSVVSWLCSATDLEQFNDYPSVLHLSQRQAQWPIMGGRKTLKEFGSIAVKNSSYKKCVGRMYYT